MRRRTTVNDLAALLPLVAILALFWFMVIRPQQRRQKEVVALQNSIQVGQRVMMSSGVFGTVVSLTEDRARLEIAPGTQIEIARAAIAKVDEPVDQAGVDERDERGDA
ncbi:preprotein translocase subunit YajC [Nocardioides eburneiflavus]|uniref:Preprotein translocase subunit YajC n=1 Tax=Nocardioides eburneiflavus TaxID=2518372 RepID=A0A4Z1CLI7_9ACTN|nr:preprotein translocase subunit YajC [Nocardioides eburneiflavus]